jgi:hypothetical protein
VYRLLSGFRLAFPQGLILSSVNCFCLFCFVFTRLLLSVFCRPGAFNASSTEPVSRWSAFRIGCSLRFSFSCSAYRCGCHKPLPHLSVRLSYPSSFWVSFCFSSSPFTPSGFLTTGRSRLWLRTLSTRWEMSTLVKRQKRPTRRGCIS